jgi:hypothetical protein
MSPRSYRLSQVLTQFFAITAVGFGAFAIYAWWTEHPAQREAVIEEASIPLPAGPHKITVMPRPQ